MPALGHKNICRLDVTVNNALRVCGVERVGDFNCKREQALSFKRLTGNHVLECDAFEILHRDEGTTLIFTDVVNRTNVGMGQRGCGLGLALKPCERRGIFRQFRRQKFQRDEAMQPGVLGFVDDAHAAAAQLLEDAVMRNVLAVH